MKMQIIKRAKIIEYVDFPNDNMSLPLEDITNTVTELCGCDGYGTTCIIQNKDMAKLFKKYDIVSVRDDNKMQYGEGMNLQKFIDKLSDILEKVKNKIN